MALKKGKSPKTLGNNPLDKGIFSKTDTLDASPIIKNEESRFLEKGEREAVNLRLPLELNDWLNELLKIGKRRHGQKIPKEVWVQAALELFRSMPVDWASIEDEEGLRQALVNLESRIKTIE